MNRRHFLQTSLSASGLLAAGALGCATTPTRGDGSVVVIGAGMAGITTARALQDAGYTVTVLEAQSQAGGRMRTTRMFGPPVDLGASWIHGVRRNPIAALAQEFGAEYARTDWSNLGVFDADGDALSERATAELRPQLSTIYRKAYWKESFEHADEAADEILEDARRRSTLSREDIAIPEDYLSETELKEVEALRRVRLQAEGEYKEYGGGDHIVLSGYGTIVNELVKGLDIRTGVRVQSIDYSGQQVRVVTESGSLVADRVVLTVPLGVLKAEAISFTPELPSWKSEAIDRLGMTVFNKIVLRYPEAFWPRDPHGFARVDDRVGGTPFFFNLHHYTKEPILLYLASSSHAREIEKLSQEDAVVLATDALRDMFGSRVPLPEQGLRTGWGNNPFSRGSYSFRRFGSTSADRKALARPINDRVFFAGEATHVNRYATVHGAYLSGLQAAKDVLKA